MLLGAATLGAPPAVAQELRGLFDTSYGVTTSKSSDGTKSDFQTNRQSLDVNWNKILTPFLGYRFTLRGERSEAATKVNDVTSDTTSIMVQPLADFTLASPFYSLNAGLRLRELFSEGSGAGSSQLSDRNYFLRFFYTPEHLPSASFTIDRTTSTDDKHTRDTAQTRYQASVQHTVGDATGSYTFSRLVDDDNIAETTRTQDSHLANLGYSSRFFRDRLTVQANASGTKVTTTEEFSRLGQADVPRALVRGLSAAPDDTPLNSSDIPVVTAPGLVSGGGAAPLALKAAVGFELATREPVARIDITVAPAPPFTVLPPGFGGSIAFEVFATDDVALLSWNPVTVVSQAFDTVQNKFQITIASTTARFFKAWVFVGTPAPLANATGIAAVDVISVVRGEQRVTESLGGSFTGALVFTPVPWGSASYNVTLNGNRQDPEKITTWSGTHAATVTVQPHRLLTVSGTAQYSFASSDQPEFQPTTSTSYTLTLGSTPLPTLTSSLTAARTENFLSDVLQNRSDAGTFTMAAKVLPRLNADSTLGITRAEDFVTHQVTLTRGGSLNLNAQVLPRINTLFNYSLQFQDVTPPSIGAAASTVTQTIGGGTTYTISRVVNFTTRFDYTLATTGTAFSQAYKLDWIPTYKTSMFLAYRRTTTEADNPVGGGALSGGSDSVEVNARWSVSRNIDISANGSYARTVAGDIVQTVMSFNIAAGFRF